MLAAGLSTDNDEGDRDCTPSPSVAPRPHEQTDDQASFRTKFGIADSDLLVVKGSRFTLNEMLNEVTGGRAQEWYKTGEMDLPSCFDWLLKDDKEVVDMLSFERRLIRHHNNSKEPWDFHMSLAHQAARQDPGVYLMAAACLESSLVVAVPFKGEGSFFIELSLDDHTGNMRIARQPSAPGVRRLSLAFAGLSEDGTHIEDSENSSWDKYVIGHARAQSALDDTEIPLSIQVRSASALGSAVLCQLQWLTPHCYRSVAGFICGDRALARHSIQRTRVEILHQLKIALRELVMTEAFHLEGDAYYATLASDNSNTNDEANDEAPERKRRRTRKW